MRILLLTTLLLAACGGTRTMQPAPPTPAPTPAATPPAPPATDSEIQAEVDALVFRLFNEDETVRVRGATRLGDLGAQARSALPYLRDCARLNTGATEKACIDAVFRIKDAG